MKRLVTGLIVATLGFGSGCAGWTAQRSGADASATSSNGLRGGNALYCPPNAAGSAARQTPYSGNAVKPRTSRTTSRWSKRRSPATRRNKTFRSRSPMRRATVVPR